MSYIEIEHNQQIGWFCNNDLLLICDQQTVNVETSSPFMDDTKLQSLISSYRTQSCGRRRRRFIPKVDFTDEKLFPTMLSRFSRSAIINQSLHEKKKKKKNDEELQLELSSMLACREYVSEQNHYFDRKQFQLAQAAQADEEKKLEEYQKRQQAHSQTDRHQRRGRNASYISRFDEKRYVPSTKGGKADRP